MRLTPGVSQLCCFHGFNKGPISGDAWPPGLGYLVVSHPQPEQRCLTAPDRWVSSRSQDPQIWRWAVSWSARCPSLSRCPLPSVTALLLSCGMAGSSLNPVRSICVRSSCCSPQCVSRHLRLMPENAARASLSQVARCWGRSIFPVAEGNCRT